MARRQTQEEFIKLCREKHKEKYDYSKTIYINKRTKVIVGCKEHGDFEQMSHKHVRGQGCRACAGNKLKTTDEFIQNAKKIHGNRYDYSKVEYKNNQTKVTIICKDHGKFEQTPDNHTNKKQGCAGCACNLQKTTETFIRQSKEFFKDRFDYSLVDYKNSRSKIILKDTWTDKKIQVIPQRHLFLHCKSPQCSVVPNFGFKDDIRASYCVKHKLVKMVNIYFKKCKSENCDTTRCRNLAYDGYCAYCFHNLFPYHELSKNFKTKEKAVVEWIIKFFGDKVTISYDKKVLDGCSQKRPDIMINLGSHVIIIEIDECQHKSYDTSCETMRECILYQDLGQPVVFIRFNPDAYRKDGKLIYSCWKPTTTGMTITKKAEWNERLDRLTKYINYWITHVPEKEITKRWLYFDENEN